MARSAEEIRALARKSLEMPPDFGYSGEVPLGKTWGFTPFSVHRDSEALERSNYRRIVEDLTAEFPEDFSDEHFNHWAVGWIDHLLVRAVDRRGDPTPAFLRVVEIAEKLDDYPVYDEDDFSREELEEDMETLVALFKQDVPPEMREAILMDAGANLFSELQAALDNAGIQWGSGYGRFPSEEEWLKAIEGYWPWIYHALGPTLPAVLENVLLTEVYDPNFPASQAKLSDRLHRALREASEGQIDIDPRILVRMLDDRRIYNLSSRHIDDRETLVGVLQELILQHLDLE